MSERNMVGLLKSEIKSISDLLKANLRVELGYHFPSILTIRSEHKLRGKINKVLDKLEATNTRLLGYFNTLDDLQEENKELEEKCKALEQKTQNLNAEKEEWLNTASKLRKELNEKDDLLSTTKAKQQEMEESMQIVKAKLDEESKAKKKAEAEARLYKEKQEKLVELLHQMEKGREKKSSSKKEAALAHQCQQMKESIEILTSKLEDMKEDYDDKIVIFWVQTKQLQKEKDEKIKELEEKCDLLKKQVELNEDIKMMSEY
eukprot:TRINITY_DN2168_c0_g1_i1.p5 TRINITY_DN2168_c0_g1~~TRINITY_DN2168_c0_g1_i1.p5  ORF type:complete len:261 (+),score=64.76 TRINITY_DN2168_c0_g1_i1:3714-4496(+)